MEADEVFFTLTRVAAEDTTGNTEMSLFVPGRPPLRLNGEAIEGDVTIIWKFVIL